MLLFCFLDRFNNSISKLYAYKFYIDCVNQTFKYISTKDFKSAHNKFIKQKALLNTILLQSGYLLSKGHICNFWRKKGFTRLRHSDFVSNRIPRRKTKCKFTSCSMWIGAHVWNGLWFCRETYDSCDFLWVFSCKDMGLYHFASNIVMICSNYHLFSTDIEKSNECLNSRLPYILLSEKWYNLKCIIRKCVFTFGTTSQRLNEHCRSINSITWIYLIASIKIKVDIFKCEQRSVLSRAYQ